MRTIKYALPLVIAIVLAAQVRADDPPPSTLTGTLAEKPADAKDGVVAVLKVKNGDAEVAVNLWADGDTAKTLTEWAGKKATVTVTGAKVDDANVKVAKVEKKE